MKQLDCQIATNEYGTYCVPNVCAENEALAKCIIGGDVHEKVTIEAILANRGNGVVIHAGTYFGDFLPAISGPGHRVYAFEPGEMWYRCAKITLDLNFPAGEHSTKLYNFGLGAEHIQDLKLLTMHNETIGEGGASRIMTHPDGVEEYRMETIEVAPLDLIVAEKDEVSVLQLDIEGYEEQALMGARKILTQSRPLLILEVANDTLIDTEFYRDFIFGELGYVQEGDVHGNLIFRSKN